MEDLRQWLPIAILIISNVIMIVWSWAKLDKKIELLNAVTAEKFNSLSKEISEIKENHIHELRQDINNLSQRLDAFISKY